MDELFVAASLTVKDEHLFAWTEITIGMTDRTLVFWLKVRGELQFRFSTSFIIILRTDNEIEMIRLS